MLRVIPFMILLAAFVMVVTEGSKDKVKTKYHRLSSVPKSSRKLSFFANKKLTSTHAPYSFNKLRPRLESTGCLPGSCEMNPKFGCSRSSCRTKFPFTTAALCFGKQGNSCCKKVDFRKDHFEESECLSSCDVRTSGLDNHALCRQRHPATLDADCRYFYDLFKSQNGFENSFDTCCSAQYAYECPGTPGRWITADRFCDQKMDCPMATDEIGCSDTTTTTLATTTKSTLATTTTTTVPPVVERVFDCLNEGQDTSTEVIPMIAVCNGTEECSNGADEKTCIALASNLPLAPLDENENPLELYLYGYLVARKDGNWSPYCSNTWDDKQTMEVCKFLGFTAEEVSFTQALPQNAFEPTSACPHALHLTCGP